MHIDEAGPVFVFEVRPEWLKGRGRYFLPKGAGYTNDLSRAGLWVQVPNSTLMQDPDGTGPTYSVAADKYRAILAMDAFAPFAEFAARMCEAAQCEGEPARRPAGTFTETSPEGETPPSGPVALHPGDFAYTFAGRCIVLSNGSFGLPRTPEEIALSDERSALVAAGDIGARVAEIDTLLDALRFRDPDTELIREAAEQLRRLDRRTDVR